ncbi:hypothetical protein BKA81DRAFT_375776 [Phyllosticta paracitricarpa]
MSQTNVACALEKSRRIFSWPDQNRNWHLDPCQARRVATTTETQPESQSSDVAAVRLRGTSRGIAICNSTVAFDTILLVRQVSVIKMLTSCGEDCLLAVYESSLYNAITTRSEQRRRRWPVAQVPGFETRPATNFRAAAAYPGKALRRTGPDASLQTGPSTRRSNDATRYSAAFDTTEVVEYKIMEFAVDLSRLICLGSLSALVDARYYSGTGAFQRIVRRLPQPSCGYLTPTWYRAVQHSRGQLTSCVLGGTRAALPGSKELATAVEIQSSSATPPRVAGCSGNSLIYGAKQPRVGRITSGVTQMLRA